MVRRGGDLPPDAMPSEWKTWECCGEDVVVEPKVLHCEAGQERLEGLRQVR